MEWIRRRNSSPPSENGSEDRKGGEEGGEDILLPGLPNHISQICLSELSPRLLFSVCQPWRQLLYSPSFPPFCSLYVLLSTKSSGNREIEFFSLDPLSLSWRPLPPPPPLDFLAQHPSYLSRNLAIQSLTVGNYLVLLAGTTQQLTPALSRPLVFNPETGKWFFGPQFSAPRRWCAAGAVGNVVFLAGGMGATYNASVARSMEQWKITGKRQNWKWERLRSLQHGRFSREDVEGVAHKGKLCMVNMKGRGVKEGTIYNPATDAWEEMPEGMLEGWNGPAAAMDEESIYVVDEERGTLSKYDGDYDRWEKIIELPELKQAEQITAGHGKVCVVAGNGKRVLVLDVVSNPALSWTVDLPCGHECLGVRILPRMCQ